MTSSDTYSSKEFRITLLVLFAAIISLSPVFLLLRPLSGNIFSLSCILLFFLFYKRALFRPYVYGVFFTTLLLSSFLSVYWLNLKLLVLPIYFLSALLLLSKLTNAELQCFAAAASKMLRIVLVGCLIGFFYVLAGGEALVEFSNEDGRMTGLYLTTLSNSKVLRILRPAGIFDEPGTLSFVVCNIAALRHSLRMNKKMTWTLLSLGFITFSVAHLFYTLMHLAAEFKGSVVKSIKYLMLVLSVIAAVIYFVPAVNELLWNNLFQRFVFQSSGFAGDNRTQLLISAINYLDWRVFFWGLDADCITNIPACTAKGYLQFGENPLGPLVLYGIFNSWPYYVLEAILFIIFIWRLDFVSLGIFLLLLQRPSLMSFGFSLLVMTTAKAIFLHSCNIKFRWIRQRKLSDSEDQPPPGNKQLHSAIEFTR